MTVKEAVKESLLGSSEEPKLSHQVKHHFFHHARKDESTGEFYMTEDEFINAIAPKHEDYVRFAPCFPSDSLPIMRCVIALVIRGCTPKYD
jgi:hypothetical protein